LSGKIGCFGSEELIKNGVSGVVASERNFFNELINLINNPFQRWVMGWIARSKILQKYSLEDLFKNQERFYKKVLK
jgi:hypothetical protein